MYTHQQVDHPQVFEVMVANHEGGWVMPMPPWMTTGHGGLLNIVKRQNFFANFTRGGWEIGGEVFFFSIFLLNKEILLASGESWLVSWGYQMVCGSNGRLRNEAAVVWHSHIFWKMLAGVVVLGTSIYCFGWNLSLERYMNHKHSFPKTKHSNPKDSFSGVRESGMVIFSESIFL